MWRCNVRCTLTLTGRRNRAGLNVSLNTNFFTLFIYLNIRNGLDLSVGKQKEIFWQINRFPDESYIRDQERYARVKQNVFLRANQVVFYVCGKTYLAEIVTIPKC